MCEKQRSVESTIETVQGLRNLRLDACIKSFIRILNHMGVHTVACCCGHGRYPMTVICRLPTTDTYYDLISGTEIPRSTYFYQYDKDRYAYITEISEPVR